MGKADARVDQGDEEVGELGRLIRRIRDERQVTVLLVEQDTHRALAASDRVYCLQEGRVTLDGRPADLTRERIKLAYFGV